MTPETFFVGLGALIVFGGAMWAAVKAAFVTSLFLNVLINTIFGRSGQQEAQQHMVYLQPPQYPQSPQYYDAEATPRYER